MQRISANCAATRLVVCCPGPVFIRSASAIIARTDLVARAGRKETYVLVRSNDNAVTWLNQNTTTGVNNARDFNQPFIDDNFGIAGRIDSDAELGATNSNRCCGTIDAIWIRAAAKVVDADPNSPDRDAQELSQRTSIAIILQNYQRAGLDDEHAPVTELKGHATTASRIDLIVGIDNDTSYQVGF